MKKLIITLLLILNFTTTFWATGDVLTWSLTNSWITIINYENKAIFNEEQLREIILSQFVIQMIILFIFIIILPLQWEKL